MQVEANRREAFLAEKADAIRSLAKNVVRDVIKIGRHLSEAKGKFGRGDNPEFLTWTNEALGWSKSSVYNFINVYDLVQGGNFPNFGNFDLSSLYLLAAPSTPPEVIAEVAERSQRGEQVTVAQVRELVTASKEAEVHRITAPSRSSTQPEPERPISIVRSSTPTVTTHAVTLSRDVGEALSLVVAMETCAFSDAKMAELARAATELGRNREALRRVAQAIIDALDGGRPVRSLNAEETVH
jgi:hypothetical protein